MPSSNTLARGAGVALIVSLVCSGGTLALDWVQPPAMTQDAGRGAWMATFELSEAADVEVAIVDADSKVVRHLAAGVLGRNPPPPLAADSLKQRIEWDGRDDFGEKVPAGRPLRLRVRAGMAVALERIVGGDPYAFYSKQMGQGDHAAWRIMGLEAKPDGTVYVLGNADIYGPPALRAYDAAGGYLRTVYPPPAGKPLDTVKGWAVFVRPDGSYTPQYNDLSSPALSRTILCGTRGRIATLVPCPAKDQLQLTYESGLMTVNTDGTIPPSPMLADRLVNEPSMVPAKGQSWELTGPMQVCLSPDGKSFYLSGIFAGTLGERGRRTGAETTGFWRDGQVFKVDFATRKATAFFALDAEKVIGGLGERGASPIADAMYGTYAALAGVAADAEGNVFVCDRQNKRVLVLDGDARILREIPCSYPDAVAVSPKSKALYVTTRTGHYHGAGSLKLLKFADWSRDSAPAATLPLCEVRQYSQPTHLATAEADGQVYLWVAYTGLPVRVYRDAGAGLELAKDFYEAGPQRALDLQHFVADPKTDHLYFADGFGSAFRITDWTNPQFVRCMQAEDKPLGAINVAIDARGRWLYARGDRTPVSRYALGGEFLTPAPVGGSKSNVVTAQISNDWRIGLGRGARGLAVAPDGSVVTMNALGSGPDYGGHLYFWHAEPNKAPWEPLLFASFDKVRSGGVRFDLRGNLYAGKYDGTIGTPPAGFEKDPNFAASTGRIYKFAPTGSPDGDNLFPTEPAEPAKVYDVQYGSIGPHFSRTPGFGVDGYGRIYYPSSLVPQVSVIDNEGNPILSFGTYGNRDSTGGLAGELVPTKDVPMAWPNCVDATDDYIYVSDIVNIRLLRLAKRFKLEGACKVESKE